MFPTIPRINQDGYEILLEDSITIVDDDTKLSIISKWLSNQNYKRVKIGAYLSLSKYASTKIDLFKGNLTKLNKELESSFYPIYYIYINPTYLIYNIFTSSNQSFHNKYTIPITFFQKRLTNQS